MRILVTCPPMLGMRDQFLPEMEKLGLQGICAETVQTLSEVELIKILPEYDGWIIGDDPATKRVFEAGKAGRLKAAVKWGIGIDNVDMAAAKQLGIPISNTPNMFGAEVADIGTGYLIALARETFAIDRGIRSGQWPKNRGMSLSGRTVGLVGYGDIGKNAADRLLAFGLNLIVYDPGISSIQKEKVSLSKWPDRVEECDFLFFTCSLNANNKHMLNADVILKSKDRVRIVNVARGGLIDESALVEALKNGKIHSVALDVFEEEPLPLNSYLREHPLCILGSHNSSNTQEAVIRTNLIAIEKMAHFLGIKHD